MGYSWPGIFLLGASGPTGRFFTQLLFHDPISISLWSSSLELYVTWIVYYVSMICLVSFSLFVNKASAWLEESRTQGLCVFLLDKLRFRGEGPIPMVGTHTHTQKKKNKRLIAGLAINLVRGGPFCHALSNREPSLTNRIAASGTRELGHINLCSVLGKIKNFLHLTRMKLLTGGRHKQMPLCLWDLCI